MLSSTRGTQEDLNKSRCLYDEGDKRGTRFRPQTGAWPGLCRLGSGSPSSSKLSRKMKILSLVSLGAKLKNTANEQGPPPPVKAVSLTLRTGRLV